MFYEEKSYQIERKDYSRSCETFTNAKRGFGRVAGVD
jgi:hypothetical protein